MEEDPTLLHVLVCRQSSTEAGAAAVPTAVAEQAKFGNSCSGDERTTARGQSYRWNMCIVQSQKG